MRNTRCKRLREIASLIAKSVEMPPGRTYLRHKVTGELRCAGERAVYKFAKRLYKQGHNTTQIVNICAVAAAQAKRDYDGWKSKQAEGESL